MASDRKYTNNQRLMKYDEFAINQPNLIMMFNNLNISVFMCESLKIDLVKKILKVMITKQIFHAIIVCKNKTNPALTFLSDLSELHKLEDVKKVLKNVVGSTCLKCLKTEYSKFNFELFDYEHLTQNITKHKLVPTHTLMQEYEIIELCNKIKYKYDKIKKTHLQYFPKIYSTDKVVKYYNWSVGSVIRIDRTIGLTAKYTYYRTIIKK